ncbi:hypothetical protein BOX15_Mlig015030g1 [Macrostomum lignano]|uniref:Uncharacterized protein n=2 Tax=Macrostomum lignano TaxID=282301 RepID=A0A267F3L2_9PLAT|nr:hypothetical protein BOX15_Mlig015030g1 [Macrostomum lignano]
MCQAESASYQRLLDKNQQQHQQPQQQRSFDSDSASAALTVGEDSDCTTSMEEEFTVVDELDTCSTTAPAVDGQHQPGEADEETSAAVAEAASETSGKSPPRQAMESSAAAPSSSQQAAGGGRRNSRKKQHPTKNQQATAPSAEAVLRQSLPHHNWFEQKLQSTGESPSENRQFRVCYSTSPDGDRRQVPTLRIVDVRRLAEAAREVGKEGDSCDAAEAEACDGDADADEEEEEEDGAEEQGFILGDSPYSPKADSKPDRQSQQAVPTAQAPTPPTPPPPPPPDEAAPEEKRRIRSGQDADAYEKALPLKKRRLVQDSDSKDPSTRSPPLSLRRKEAPVLAVPPVCRDGEDEENPETAGQPGTPVPALEGATSRADRPASAVVEAAGFKDNSARQIVAGDSACGSAAVDAAGSQQLQTAQPTRPSIKTPSPPTLTVQSDVGKSVTKTLSAVIAEAAEASLGGSGGSGEGDGGGPPQLQKTTQEKPKRPQKRQQKQQKRQQLQQQSSLTPEEQLATRQQKRKYNKRKAAVADSPSVDGETFASSTAAYLQQVQQHLQHHQQKQKQQQPQQPQSQQQLLPYCYPHPQQQQQQRHPQPQRQPLSIDLTEEERMMQRCGVQHPMYPTGGVQNQRFNCSTAVSPTGYPAREPARSFLSHTGPPGFAKQHQQQAHPYGQQQSYQHSYSHLQRQQPPPPQPQRHIPRQQSQSPGSQIPGNFDWTGTQQLTQGPTTSKQPRRGPPPPPPTPLPPPSPFLPAHPMTSQAAAAAAAAVAAAAAAGPTAPSLPPPPQAQMSSHGYPWSPPPPYMNQRNRQSSAAAAAAAASSGSFRGVPYANYGDDQSSCYSSRYHQMLDYSPVVKPPGQSPMPGQGYGRYMQPQLPGRHNQLQQHMRQQQQGQLQAAPHLPPSWLGQQQHQQQLEQAHATEAANRLARKVSGGDQPGGNLVYPMPLRAGQRAYPTPPPQLSTTPKPKTPKALKQKQQQQQHFHGQQRGEHLMQYHHQQQPQQHIPVPQRENAASDMMLYQHAMYPPTDLISHQFG